MNKYLHNRECVLMWTRSARARVPVSCHSVVTFSHFPPRDERVTRGGSEGHAHMQISSSGLGNELSETQVLRCQAMGVTGNVCKFDISFLICIYTHQSGFFFCPYHRMHFNLFKCSRRKVMCPVISLTTGNICTWRLTSLVNHFFLLFILYCSSSSAVD